VNHLNNRWLTGGRGTGNIGINTRNYLDGDYEQQKSTSTYQWTVRSESGDGRREDLDPLAGRPVFYSDTIFLQVNNLNNRWLTGGRDSGNNNVYTKNYLDGGYEQKSTTAYQWTILHGSGDGSVPVSSVAQIVSPEKHIDLTGDTLTQE